MYYNTGKVLIGCAYEMPKARMDADARLIQSVLLHKVNPSKFSQFMHKVLSRFLG